MNVPIEVESVEGSPVSSFPLLFVSRYAVTFGIASSPESREPLPLVSMKIVPEMLPVVGF